MSIEIRPITDDELDAFARATFLQFGEDPDEDFIEILRGSVERDRTSAAFEGGRIIGTAETVSFTMGVPGGGTAPCGGLTSVGVHPLRRRRGILDRLMRAQLDLGREREEPFGALYASESPIYGRYGYGPAVPGTSWKIATAHARLADPAVGAELVGAIELVDAEEALQRLPAIRARLEEATPGMMSRPPGWWRGFLRHDPEGQREGFTARHHAILGDRGYVVYRIKPGWTDRVPDGTLQVVEHLAADAEAALALWRLCLGMDLISTVEAPLRPADEPLAAALADPVRLRAEPAEPMYLRLLALPAAVAARRYAGEGGAVLAVRDRSCPWNEGTWRLDLGPEGGSCTATDDEPELSLDVADLATAFLGGVRLTQLVRARRVEEHRDGAAWRLDRLLACDPLPWNSRVF